MFAVRKLISSTSLTPANDNPRLRLVDHDYYLTNRTVSGGIANWTYTTNASGNVTAAGATTYGYDALQRINAENAGAATSYTYDATSNRLTKVQGGTTTTTVPAGNNKISAVGANSYTYDAAGDITGDGVNTYTWSAAGNLATVNTTGGVYTYDWQNRRSKKVAGGTTTYYVYGPNSLLYGEYTSAGALSREYVYLNGAPLAQVNAGTPEVLTYLHTDHLGTPRFGTNSGGTQVWSWTNDAFGTSTPTGTATVNLRMPGQYYDSESGTFYNWNRYYNPAIGRYLSPDPIGLAGGINPFSYVRQNPTNYSDPEGLTAEMSVPVGAVGGAIICLTSPACVNAIQNAAKTVGKGIEWCEQAINKISAPDPGSCTPEQQQRYQENVENQCGAAVTCYGTDSVDVLNQKIGQHSRCIDARRLINNLCYGGGDAGHNKAIDDRINAIKRCQSFLSQPGLR